MFLNGLLNYNQGDLDNAEIWMLHAHQADSSKLSFLLALVQTYNRSKKRPQIQNLLDFLNPSVMVGSPIEKMYLAQLLSSHGRVKDGFAYGYQILCEYFHNADVVIAYVNLIILSPDENAIPVSHHAAPGFWIALKNQHDESFECIIENEIVSLREGVFPSTHPLVAAALGLKIGEGFEQKRNFLPSLHWTLKEIKHKYVHALQCHG